MSADILIVDDEEDIRNLIQGILEDEGYETRVAASAFEAYRAINERTPSLVVQDIWLQGGEDDGLAILKKIKEQYPYLPFLMISGHGTIETAVSAIQDGAYDFIEKPFKSDRLILMIQRALENASLKKENAVLKKQAQKPVALIGDSAHVQGLKQIIGRVADTNSRVLITGEQGTGKDIVARMIHGQSDRAQGPYMLLNCATLRPEHLELELFGQRGSAVAAEQTGLLEQADGGTLLLDEVGDMPLETQTKIVRVLQEQRFQKIGSQDFIEVDLRILASTHKDLQALMEAGCFRQDLYYRLNVVPILIPSLRERKTDIEAFCQFFLADVSGHAAVKPLAFSDKALRILRGYDWPGNIRQLRNVIEWITIMHGVPDDGFYGLEHLPPEIQSGAAASSNFVESHGADDYMEMSLREAREAFETSYLTSQVERFEGNISRTAQFVGMERSALHRKLKSLDILGKDKEEDEGDNTVRLADTKFKRA